MPKDRHHTRSDSRDRHESSRNRRSRSPLRKTRGKGRGHRRTSSKGSPPAWRRSDPKRELLRGDPLRIGGDFFMKTLALASRVENLEEILRNLLEGRPMISPTGGSIVRLQTIKFPEGAVVKDCASGEILEFPVPSDLRTRTKDSVASDLAQEIEKMLDCPSDCEICREIENCANASISPADLMGDSVPLDLSKPSSPVHQSLGTPV